MRALSEEIPVFPKVANWDIKQLRKHWQSLSGICHSPQTLDSKLTDRWLHASAETIFSAYQYMNEEIASAQGTGVLVRTNAKPEYKKLCDDFLAGKIGRTELRTLLRELLKANAESAS